MASVAAVAADAAQPPPGAPASTVETLTKSMSSLQEQVRLLLAFTPLASPQNRP